MSTISKFSLSASLARRLAEAADGFRNVDQVFFIAGYQLPHLIFDFPDLKSANDYFSEKGLLKKEYGIFGPYKTIDELADLNLLGVEEIEKIDLVIHLENGCTQSVTLSGKIDSIFLNLSAFDKFVFPYYCHVSGVDFAKEMREKLIDGYKEHGKVIGTIATSVKRNAGAGKRTTDMGKRLPPPKQHVNVTYFP